MLPTLPEVCAARQGIYAEASRDHAPNALYFCLEVLILTMRADLDLDNDL